MVVAGVEGCSEKNRNMSSQTRLQGTGCNCNGTTDGDVATQEVAAGGTGGVPMAPLGTAGTLKKTKPFLFQDSVFIRSQHLNVY